MPNVYADVLTWSRMQLPAGAVATTGDAIEILRLLNAASRSVDSECSRYFYDQRKVRYVDVRSRRYVLEINEDIVSLSEVAVDVTGDLTYSKLLTSSLDYDLLNLDADDQLSTPPFQALRLSTRSGATLARWVRGSQTVRLTGVFGYSADRILIYDAGGTQLTATVTDTTTPIVTISGAASPPLSAGVTLDLAGEQLYLMGGSGTSFLARRGVNGSTPAAHAATPIYAVAYPDVVTQAVVMQVARLWARRQTPMFPHFILQGQGVGAEVLSQGLDPDIASMLRPVRNPAS